MEDAKLKLTNTDKLSMSDRLSILEVISAEVADFVLGKANNNVSLATETLYNALLILETSYKKDEDNEEKS